MPTTQLKTSQIKDWAITNAKQNFGTPASAGDAVILSYLQSYVADQIWQTNLKDSVRVATTVNGTLSTAFANWQTVDGVVLATNDRILIKNQSTGSENGIYVVQASWAPVRASDADTAWDISDAVVYVSQWTTNQDTGWKLVTDNIVLWTTALVFTALVISGLTSGNFVISETPSGTINGSNTSFTLWNTPVAWTVQVFLNWLLQTVTDDYTISWSTITYIVAPVSGDVLRCTYIK